MEEMWEANCTVIRDVIAQTGIDAADIAGLSPAAGTEKAFISGARTTASPLAPVSSLQIIAPGSIRFGGKKDGTAEKVFAKSCQHIMACQPVSLLAWLQDHEPECLEKTQWILSVKIMCVSA